MAVKKIENYNIHQNPATNENEFDVENYLNENWNKTKEVVNNNAEELISVQGRVSALETDNTKNKSDIENLQNDNETNQSNIGELRQKTEQIEENILSIEKGQTTQNKSIEQNTTDITDLKAETNELQKKNKLFNISITNLGNLFDCNFYKDNTQTNATYPNGASLNGWISSDFIEIEGNKEYRTSGAIMYMNFYDADKQYISTGVNGTTYIKDIISPVSAKYCILSCQKTDINNLVVADMEYYIGNIEDSQLNFKRPLYKFNNYILSNENIIDNSIPFSKLDEETQNKINNVSSYYKDKIINFLGDSITYGYNGNYANDSIARVSKPYPDIVKELLNCNLVNNYGSNGSTIAGDGINSGTNPMKEKCKQYAIPVLDFYNESGCIPQIESFKINNLPDGLHPNQAYYYTLAKKIANFIETL